MKKINFLSLIFTFLLAFAFSNVKAQETSPTDETKPNQTVRPFKIMQALGLSPEQVQQIRRINQQRKPIMQTAQQNWREANRNLDAAIYADDATDEQVRDLTKIAQTAQTTLLKERTLTEYQIRKVLTPEQLVKFRQLREEIKQRVENLNNPTEQPDKSRNRRQQRRIQNRQP